MLPPGVSLDSTPSDKGNGQSMDAQRQPIQSATNNVVLAALFKAVPEPGAEWSRDARRQWMQILEGTFDLLYKDKEG